MEALSLEGGIYCDSNIPIYEVSSANDSRVWQCRTMGEHKGAAEFLNVLLRGKDELSTSRYTAALAN